MDVVWQKWAKHRSTKRVDFINKSGRKNSWHCVLVLTKANIKTQWQSWNPSKKNLLLHKVIKNMKQKHGYKITLQTLTQNTTLKTWSILNSTVNTHKVSLEMHWYIQTVQKYNRHKNANLQINMVTDKKPTYAHKSKTQVLTDTTSSTTIQHTTE